jgi:aspartyl-tRNA(Asn)/glutamyl-tRNA(Gln) amidotransferase subunit A
LSTLRIGVARSFFFDALEPDVARAIERSLDRFRALGASVEDVNIPLDSETMSRVFDPIVVSEIWSRLGDDWRTRPGAFSPGFAGFFKTPRPSGAEGRASRRALSDFQRSIDGVFERVQILLTPTVPITAPRIEGPIDGALILRNTWPFNAAGTPAISIPCGVNQTGLPIGLQLVSRRQHDRLLLGAARRFEESDK